MTGSMSIGGYDPYFMQAYNSPNYYQQMTTGQTNQQQVQGTTIPETVTQAQQSAIPNTQAPEKKDSNAGLILGTVATVGAALLCRKAYKAGSGKGVIEKITNGFKTMFKNIKKPKEHFNVRYGNNDELLCQIPNQRNLIRNNPVTELNNIGASTSAPAITRVVDGKTILGEGITLKDYTFTHAGETYKVVRGKLQLPKGSSLIEAKSKKDKALKETLEKMVTGFNKGENISSLKDITYKHKQDGLSRMFTQADINSPAQIKCAVSRDFHVNSEAVKAYRINNPEINATLKKIEAGKIKDLTPTEVKCPSPIGTFRLKNGEIEGIEINGTFYPKGSQKYDALNYDHEKIFENVIKDKKHYQDPIYVLN